MNFIKQLFKSSVNSRITTKLGRWQLHYDPRIVHCKVDQANEDHCGCCHDPILKPTNSNKDNEALNQPTDDYYIPYMMSSF